MKDYADYLLRGGYTEEDNKKMGEMYDFTIVQERETVAQWKTISIDDLIELKYALEFLFAHVEGLVWKEKKKD